MREPAKPTIVQAPPATTPSPQAEASKPPVTSEKAEEAPKPAATTEKAEKASKPATTEKAEEASKLPAKKAETAKKAVKTKKAVEAKGAEVRRSSRSNEIKQGFYAGKLAVKKGDNLSYLASQGWGASRLWKKLAAANGISETKPRSLIPGEILVIPDPGIILVTNHLTSPYKAKAKGEKILAAIDQTFYSPAIKAEMKKKVMSEDPTESIVRKGDIVDYISSGKTGVTYNPSGYKFAWMKLDSLTSRLWGNIYAEGKKCYVEIIDLCGNFVSKCMDIPVVERPVSQPPTTTIEPTPTPRPIPVPPVFQPPSSAKPPARKLPPVPAMPPIKKSLPPIPTYTEKISHQKFEMYVGAGVYEAVGRPQSDGSFYWLLARYRPFEYRLTKKVDGALGVFGFLSGGYGHDNDTAGNVYNYDHFQAVGGATNKLYGEHWDTDHDLGVGMLWNEGGNKFTDNHQRDVVVHFNNHVNLNFRRDAGKKILPNTELNFGLRLPVHTDKNNNGQAETDNTSVSASVFQGIYDVSLWKDYKLTPGINLTAGRDYSVPNAYLQYGPGVALYKGKDALVKVDLLNYKHHIGKLRNQWYYIGGFVSVHGLWKAAYGSMIKEVPADSVPSTTGAQTEKVSAAPEVKEAKADTSPVQQINNGQSQIPPEIANALI